MVLLVCKFPAPVSKFVLFHDTQPFSPVYTLTGRGNKFTSAFRACLFLPSQKSWELFHFVTVMWQWPGHEQNHKHLSSISLIFQNSFTRCYFISTFPSIIWSVSKLCYRYPVHRTTVSNLISAPVAPFSNLRIFYRRKKARSCDKNEDNFIILPTFFSRQT